MILSSIFWPSLKLEAYAPRSMAVSCERRATKEVSLKKGGELLPREGIIYDAGEIEGIK